MANLEFMFSLMHIRALIHIVFHRSNQTVPVPVITSGGAKLVPGLVFDCRNVAPDNASMPLASWDSANLNQQVTL